MQKAIDVYSIKKIIYCVNLFRRVFYKICIKIKYCIEINVRVSNQSVCTVLVCIICILTIRVFILYCKFTFVSIYIKLSIKQ